jgi:hypothetical protein
MINPYKAARLSVPMTQEHLAAAAGLDARTVRKLEKGGQVSAETILAVRGVLGMDPAASHPSPMASSGGDTRLGPVPSSSAFAMMSWIVRILFVLSAAGLASCIVYPRFLGPAAMLMLVPTVFVWARWTYQDIEGTGRSVESRYFFAMLLSFGTLLEIVNAGMVLASTRTMDAPPEISFLMADLHGMAGLCCALLAVHLVSFDKDPETGSTGLGSLVAATRSGQLGRNATKLVKVTAAVFRGDADLHASIRDGSSKV